MNLIEWPYYRTDFLAAQGFSPTIVQRFWAKVTITDGCWVWTGGHTTFGYGVIGRSGRGSGKIVTHHLAWIFNFGSVPDSLQVLHTCDNPPCCRPSHLWLGTQKDNVQDMWDKGRQGEGFPSKAKGEDSPSAKLTVRQIGEIRCLAEKGVSKRVIARQFSIDRSTVYYILSGKLWKHI